MRALTTSLFTFCVMGCASGNDGPDEEMENNEDLSAPPSLASDTATEQGIVGEDKNLGPAFTEAPLSAHGGTGGRFSSHVTPSAVIFGVRVSSGTYIDSIAFAWYQPTRSDNLRENGNAWGMTVNYGGSGGYNRGWWWCPTGQGVIGILGNSGTLIDRFGVICGDVSNPDPYSPANTYSPLWGGTGGYWFDDRCGQGRLVDSFNVRWGRFVNNLQAICINAH